MCRGSIETGAPHRCSGIGRTQSGIFVTRLEREFDHSQILQRKPEKGKQLVSRPSKPSCGTATDRHRRPLLARARRLVCPRMPAPTNATSCWHTSMAFGGGGLVCVALRGHASGGSRRSGWRHSRTRNAPKASLKMFPGAPCLTRKQPQSPRSPRRAQFYDCLGAQSRADIEH